MSNKAIQQGLSTASTIIGRGILAGIAGTAAITISQLIEMQLTKRSMSNAPVKVAGQVLGVEPSGKEDTQTPGHSPQQNEDSPGNKEVKEEHAERFGNIVHWGYGTAWGIGRGLIAASGLTGLQASAAHFGAVWLTELVMLPSMDASTPIYKWTPKQIGVDIFHHSVYALAAGLAYDFIEDEN